MHFLTGSAKWDFDSDVVSLGVLEKPASDWSEAFAIVVREVVIVRGESLSSTWSMICRQALGHKHWIGMVDNGQSFFSIRVYLGKPSAT